MKDKKEIILKDVFTIIEKILKKNFSKCNIDLKKQDLDLRLKKFKKKILIFRQNLSENLDSCRN